MKYCILDTNIFSAGELNHVLSLSKPKFVFCSPNTINKMVNILNEQPYIQKLVLFGNKIYKHEKVVMFQDILRGKFIIYYVYYNYPNFLTMLTINIYCNNFDVWDYWSSLREFRVYNFWHCWLFQIIAWKCCFMIWLHDVFIGFFQNVYKEASIKISCLNVCIALYSSFLKICNWISCFIYIYI